MELIAAIISGLGLLAVLGVVIAFSPTLLVTQLGILTRSKHSARNNVAFIAGIATAVLALLLIALLFIDPGKSVHLPSTRVLIQNVPFIDMIIGALLIFNGLKLSETDPSTTKIPKHKHVVGAKSLYTFGLIKMASSLSSITAILIASRYIKTTTDGPLPVLAASLWLLTVSLAPFVTLGHIRQHQPKLFHKIQQTSDRTATLNWRRLIAIALLVLGCYFLAIGLANW